MATTVEHIEDKLRTLAYALDKAERHHPGKQQWCLLCEDRVRVSYGDLDGVFVEYTAQHDHWLETLNDNKTLRDRLRVVSRKSARRKREVRRLNKALDRWISAFYNGREIGRGMRAAGLGVKKDPAFVQAHQEAQALKVPKRQVATWCGIAVTGLPREDLEKILLYQANEAPAVGLETEGSP